MSALYTLVLNHNALNHDAADKPWLVWLHGFLGSHTEWLNVAHHLPFARHLLVDLPGHGASAACTVSDFAAVSHQLNHTLAYQQVDYYWLIGYSLGGRIAMYHACYSQPPGLCGVVVEGAHPGLVHRAECQTRAQSDAQWARRFCQQPLTQVLSDWYQQPVFASLSAQQRADLIALRSQNNASALAAMLLATSLATQPDLRQPLSQLAIPFYYLCGEHDAKFRTLAHELTAPCQLISDAGHNAHRENPQQVATQLSQLLGKHTRYQHLKD